MHNAIGIPPFLVFVSILAGGAIAGIPGAFLAVPLVAAILVIVERLQARETPIELSPEKPASDAVEEIAEEVAPTS